MHGCRFTLRAIIGVLWRALAIAMCLAAAPAGAYAQALPDPLAPAATEPVPDIPQPDWTQQPIDDSWYSNFGTRGGSTLTTGNGRVFVSGGGGDILSFAGNDTRSVPQSFYVSGVGAGARNAARIAGLAYYRDELYALDSRNAKIDVLDPQTGATRRQLSHPLSIVVQGRRSVPDDDPTEAVDPATWTRNLDDVQLRGIAVAWGEVWVTFQVPATGSAPLQTGMTVLDAATGAVRAFTITAPQATCSNHWPTYKDGRCGDVPGQAAGILIANCQPTVPRVTTSAPSQVVADAEDCVDNSQAAVDGQAWSPDLGTWWDAAALPEFNAVFAQCSFTVRGSFALLPGPPQFNATQALNGPSCVHFGACRRHDVSLGDEMARVVGLERHCHRLQRQRF